VPAPVEHHTPLSRAELPTTDGATAQGNLDAQIAGEEKALKVNPHPLNLTGLASLLLSRGQFFGPLADYDRALELAQRAVNKAPKQAGPYLTRAAALSTFHRFPEALADLDRAVKLGARPEKVASAKAAIWQALGDVDAALAIRRAQAEARPSITSLGLYAAALGAIGQTAEAEHQFIEAQYHFRDVSPLPVAWLYFQHGLFEERSGNVASARDLFEAAHARLPGFAQATAHLAGVLAVTGERARAIALLEPLARASDDPEYAGLLAGFEADQGAQAEATRLRTVAAHGFDALLARHPEAFANHAARFWLGAGANPHRALALAERNLAVRKGAVDYQLELEAAVAAGDQRVACKEAKAAGRLPHQTAMLHLDLSRVSCEAGAESPESPRSKSARPAKQSALVKRNSRS
jgi:tetratricopeptide (TPR) repeat protein